MTRQQDRAAAKAQEKQDRVIADAAKAINNTMLILEASPFPVRAREAWRLLRKHRTTIQAENNAALYGHLSDNRAERPARPKPKLVPPSQKGAGK